MSVPHFLCSSEMKQFLNTKPRFGFLSRIIITIATISIIAVQPLVNYINLPSQHAESNLPRLRYETITVREIAQQRLENNTQRESQLHEFVNLYITAYLAKHKALRAACDTNAMLARTTPLIVFRGSERNFGLGDRIRGILSTFLIAAITDRLFLIDLPQPFPLDTMWISPKGFNFTYDRSLFPADESYPISDDVVVHKFSIRDFMREHRYQKVRVLVQRGMNKFSPTRMIKEARLFPAMHNAMSARGLLSFNPARDDIAPLLLQALFLPSPRLRSALRQQRPFKGRAYISLHARLGIGVGERGSRFNSTRRALSLEDIASCVGRVAGRVALQRRLHRVFIATDTRRANEALANGVRQVLPDAEIHVATGKAVHVRRLRDRVLDDSDFEDFERAFVEMGLLGGGKEIVFIKSGFADVGLWLGAMSAHTRLTPRHCQIEKETGVPADEG